MNKPPKLTAKQVNLALLDLIGAIGFLLKQEMLAVKTPSGNWFSADPRRVQWFSLPEYRKRLQSGFIERGNEELDYVLDALGAIAWRQFSQIPLVRIEDANKNARWLGPDIDSVRWFNNGEFTKRIVKSAQTEVPTVSCTEEMGGVVIA